VSSRRMPMRGVEPALPSQRITVDLNLFQIFAEIVAAGSLSRACGRLGVPKSTLSRRLRQFERQIGAVLFKRGFASLELTDSGRALLQHCQRIANEASAAAGLAAEMQSRLQGVIRVSLPLGLSDTWITQALARFTNRYPEITVSVEVTNRWVDVSEDPFDVAIHIGCIRNKTLPARRLASLGRGLYASPAYYARKGIPEHPEDLLQHDCIAMDTQLTGGLWTFSAGASGAPVMVKPRMQVTDIMIAREMATAGIGIAILTHVACSEEVRAGRLLRCLHDWPLPDIPISATFLDRRHVPHRVRAFLDEIAAAVQTRPPQE
jgi:DNA-binding transcriptional LysR family regulator